VRIKYESLRPYKYRVLETAIFQTPITPVAAIHQRYWEMGLDGTLIVHYGYAWDGPSGPTLDRWSRSAMRASLPHDVFYQAIRLGLLPNFVKGAADGYFRKLCLEDGMSKTRAGLWYTALDLFGSRRARPLASDKPQVLEAP